MAAAVLCPDAWRKLACHGKPDIFKTEQGSQSTGPAFAGVLLKNGIAISMDGKGAWRDNTSSSGRGAASNTRRCICGLTTASTRPALRSAATSLLIMDGGPIRALTARHPIKPTSPRCHSAWQLTPAGLRRSTRKNCSDNRRPQSACAQMGASFQPLQRPQAMRMIAQKARSARTVWGAKHGVL